MRKSREALLVRVTPDTTKTFCERLGVAVFTTGADLGAAAHRIPSGISPLDVRAIRPPSGLPRANLKLL